MDSSLNSLRLKANIILEGTRMCIISLFKISLRVCVEWMSSWSLASEEAWALRRRSLLSWVSFCLMPQEKQEREEVERKKRLQLYVFVMRTISYPFNAKQPTDLAKRPIKVTKQQLETIQGRFQVRTFINSLNKNRWCNILLHCYYECMYTLHLVNSSLFSNLVCYWTLQSSLILSVTELF